MTGPYRHDPAFLKAVQILIQTIKFDVNGTAGKGGNGGLTSDKAIRQSGELNIMMDRIKKLEATTLQDQSQRQLFENSVVTRLMESGFLEVEIRTECLTRCNGVYQDEVINAGWHYWNAALASRIVGSCDRP